MRDLKTAFSSPPVCVDQAIRAGFDAGRRADARKKRTIAALCAAAAILVFVLASLFAPPRAIPDASVASRPETSCVYSGRSDPRYHATDSCPEATGHMVKLQIETAREFGRTPCPACEVKE